SRPVSLTSGAGIRRACAGACLVALLAGCGGGGTPSPGGEMGSLHGTVTRGPTTPVCRKGIPCSEPASGARLGFTPNRGKPTSAVVAADGSYSVSLAPGVYMVTVVPPASIGRGLGPNVVRVPAGQTRTVDFTIDTGIR